LLTDQFIKAHPGRPVTLQELAEWMIRTGQWEQQRQNAVRELMRHLQRALRSATILDENNEPVRKYHSFFVGGTQARLWALMKDMSNENMKGSLQARSTGAFGIVKQIHRDQNYFNGHYNTGDPIQLSFNYDQRLEDQKHSDEYVDQPPPGDPEDESGT
jgi:hypothetical protein